MRTSDAPRSLVTCRGKGDVDVEPPAPVSTGVVGGVSSRVTLTVSGAATRFTPPRTMVGSLTSTVPPTLALTLIVFTPGRSCTSRLQLLAGRLGVLSPATTGWATPLSDTRTLVLQP